jgi:hypothetical protein
MENQKSADDQKHETKNQSPRDTGHGVRCLQEHGRKQASHENLHRQQYVAAQLGRHSSRSKVACDLKPSAIGS